MQQPPSRIAKGDPIHEALRKVMCVPKRAYLWTPRDEIEFVPALADEIYGDGRALIGLTTCNSRPAYYVIRIDSRWQVGMDMNAPDDAPEIMEFIDQIVWGLEDQFGSARRDDEEYDDDCCRAWPAVDDENGTMWWRMDWPPNAVSHRTERHPYSWRGNLLATSLVAA